MGRALDAAEAARGLTAPNPPVGAVVVRSEAGAEWFRGATAPPGGPHAEVAACVPPGREQERAPCS